MKSTNTIHIHITEHHLSVVAGYKLWLGKENDLNLVGTSRHPAETMEEARAMNPKPDVFILDYSFGENDTIIPYIPEFRAQFPDSSLMVATGYDYPHVIRSLHAAGADGLITKDNAAGAFIQCIRALASGGIYYCKKSRQYIEEANKLDDLIGSLTPSQKRVLAELATGKPDREICSTLNMAPSTLDNHRTRLFLKLREHGFVIYSKAELVNWYNQHAMELPEVQHHR